jgi:hypothetical protein
MSNRQLGWGRKRPFKLVAPVVREGPLHRQITILLSIEIAPPGVCSMWRVIWWSVDHAHYAGVPGTRIRRGIIAGIPDIYLEHNGHAFHIELKAADGRQSIAQRELSCEISNAGGRYAIARSAEDVLSILDHWSIPRSRRTAL